LGGHAVSFNGGNAAAFERAALLVTALSMFAIAYRLYSRLKVDSVAAKLTGNPHAAVRAFTKIAALNGLPAKWNAAATYAMSDVPPDVRARGVIGMLEVQPETDASTYEAPEVNTKSIGVPA
jgi:hypothetical protein